MGWRLRGLEVWKFGGLEVWKFGGLEVWKFGGLEVWRVGIISRREAERQRGREAESAEDIGEVRIRARNGRWLEKRPVVVSYEGRKPST